VAADDPVLLDRWLEAPVVRTHHRRAAQADADALWRAAASVRLCDTRLLGPLVRWRIPGIAADQRFAEMLCRYPFALLEQGPRHSVSGLCGRIWTLARDYPRLGGPDDFAAWAEPGTVRVLFGHWVREAGDGRAELVSEARVQPVDGAAALRVRALWAVIGGFERLIGAEPLPIAVRAAEHGRP
jgi:hypothetical protein